MRLTIALALGAVLGLVGCQDDKKNALVGDATEADAPTPTGTSVLGQEAPDPMGNPKATKKHIVDQHCLANCASIAGTCAATADDATAKNRCADEKTQCDAACQ